MPDSYKIIAFLLIGTLLIMAGAFLLSKAAGAAFKAKIHKSVELSSGSTLKAFLASILITSAIGSSTAVTLIAVSLVDSAVLSLAAAMAVVYGANIGTTVTAQVMSLHIAEYGLYILACGLIIWLVTLRFKRLSFVSQAILAGGLLFSGIYVLNMSTAIIKSSDYIMNFVNHYSQNGLYCILFGFITTALIHSSSATVGITISLFAAGVIDIQQAILITLGDNIGTCMTAQIAAIPTGISARRVAWGHTIYNIGGALLVCAFLPQFILVVRSVTRLLGQSESYLVANAHTVFNVLSALIILPFNRWFCVLLTHLISERNPRNPCKPCKPCPRAGKVGAT